MEETEVSKCLHCSTEKCEISCYEFLINVFSDSSEVFINPKNGAKDSVTNVRITTPPSHGSSFDTTSLHSVALEVSSHTMFYHCFVTCSSFSAQPALCSHASNTVSSLRYYQVPLRLPVTHHNSTVSPLLPMGLGRPRHWSVSRVHHKATFLIYRLLIPAPHYTGAGLQMSLAC